MYRRCEIRIRTYGNIIYLQVSFYHCSKSILLLSIKDISATLLPFVWSRIRTRRAKQFLFYLKIFSSPRISANIRPTVYCTGIAEGSSTEFNFLWKHFGIENVATEKMVILKALGCTTDRTLLQVNFQNWLLRLVALFKFVFLPAIFGIYPNRRCAFTRQKICIRISSKRITRKCTNCFRLRHSQQ